MLDVPTNSDLIGKVGGPSMDLERSRFVLSLPATEKAFERRTAKILKLRKLLKSVVVKV